MTNGSKAVAAALALAAAAAAVQAGEAVKLRLVKAIYAGSVGAGLNVPEGVAFDGKSRLVVADSGNGRLVTFTMTEAAITPVGEIRLPEMPYPLRLAVAADGTMLVLDGKLRRILRIGAGGEFEGYHELGGEASNGAVPRSLKLAGDGTLYVLDVGRGRVLVVGADGALKRQIAFPAEAGFVSDLAVDRRGTVYLVDSVRKRVYAAAKEDATAKPLTEGMAEDMNFPTSIVADDGGRLFLGDENGGGIVVLGNDGSFRGRQSSFGWKEGLLRYPSELALGPAGELIVADRGNDRVQIFKIVE